jgi:hypothetical protein
MSVMLILYILILCLKLELLFQTKFAHLWPGIIKSLSPPRHVITKFFKTSLNYFNAMPDKLCWLNAWTNR